MINRVNKIIQLCTWGRTETLIYVLDVVNTTFWINMNCHAADDSTAPGEEQALTATYTNIYYRQTKGYDIRNAILWPKVDGNVPAMIFIIETTYKHVSDYNVVETLFLTVMAVFV